MRVTMLHPGILRSLSATFFFRNVHWAEPTVRPAIAVLCVVHFVQTFDTLHGLRLFFPIPPHHVSRELFSRCSALLFQFFLARISATTLTVEYG